MTWKHMVYVGWVVDTLWIEVLCPVPIYESSHTNSNKLFSHLHSTYTFVATAMNNMFLYATYI